MKPYLQPLFSSVALRSNLYKQMKKKTSLVRRELYAYYANFVSSKY